MSSAAVILVTIVVAVTLAWLIYTPLPVDMDEQFKVTIIDAGTRFYGQLVSYIPCYLIAINHPK